MKINPDDVVKVTVRSERNELHLIVMEKNGGYCKRLPAGEPLEIVKPGTFCYGGSGCPFMGSIAS